MNYAAHYERLIARARGRSLVGYRERHHVLPRCMGGGDEKGNIVELTGEEHYVAHQLLAKQYPQNSRLVFAAVSMSTRCSGNKAYGWLRRKLSESMRGNNPSQETREKIARSRRGKRNPAVSEANKRRVVSDETRAKMSATRRGKKQSPGAIANNAAARLGYKPSVEARRNMSLAQLGKKHSLETKKKMSEKRLSPEHRAKISLSLLGNARARRKEPMVLGIVSCQRI